MRSSQIDKFIDSCSNPSSSDKKNQEIHFQNIENGVPFTKQELEYIANEVKKHLNSEFSVKLFSKTISGSVTDWFYENFNDDQNNTYTKYLCWYIALRYCREHKLDAEETFDIMRQNGVSENERLFYKFSSQLLKRDPNEFSEQIGRFEWANTHILQGQIAELALSYAPSSFLKNLNEYGLITDRSREMFFLRGLTRSMEVAEQLIDDEWFVRHLRSLPDSVLETLYQNFSFGSDRIRNHALLAEYKLSEAQFFAKLLTDHKFGVKIRHRFDDALGFMFSLDEKEKFLFLSIALFLNNIDIPPSDREWEFLKELKCFHDPTARFAAVLLALMARETVNNSVKETKLQPITYSIVKHAVNSIIHNIPNDLLLSKWNAEIHFRAHVSKFLAELIYAERINVQSRQQVLQHFVQFGDWFTTETLRAITFCLQQRLYKPLINGEHPLKILRGEFQQTLELLGSPHNCTISTEDISKLQYHEDIGHYARGLLRLSPEDQSRIVPYFFNFLHLSAQGTLLQNRYDTLEVQEIFQKVDQEKWIGGSRFTVAELKQIFPEIVPHEDAFDVTYAIIQSLENGHGRNGLGLNSKEAFSALINSGEILDSKQIELASKSSDAQEKIKYVQDRLIKLYQSEPYSYNQQLHLIKQLKKKYPLNDDFNNDLNQWQKALQRLTSKKQRSYDDHTIIRSDDPYDLFRVGSLAGETCQRVTGDPAKNKCLLAYPCDGKNQLIYSEGPRGERLARAILRFFKAGTLNNGDFTFVTFILYLEPVYPAGAPEDLRLAITLSALKCAKDLNVPLVRRNNESQNESNPGYPYILQTINGPAPYEYYDGLEEGRKVKSNNYVTSGGCISEFFGWISSKRIKVLYEPKPE